MEFIKSKLMMMFFNMYAEPLVDTFNKALRRLLLSNGAKVIKAEQQVIDPKRVDGLLQNLPNQTPQALRHTLEVALLKSKFPNYSRLINEILV